MQIKRFEAADMTDALRLVKRELGDDAVILSAKEIRPRGFFSALRKKHVEITAAVDEPSNDGGSDDAFSGLLAQQLEAVSASDRISISSSSGSAGSTPAPPKQPTKPDQQAVGDGADGGLNWRRRKADRTKPVAAVAGSREGGAATRLTPDASKQPPQDPDLNQLVADPFYSNLARRKVIAIVGPPGAGKSTTLAKLAWRCQVAENKRVALISLDRFSLSANSLLKTIGRIMKLKLSVVRDADEMQAALNTTKDADVVLIDTPGMTASDHTMRADISAMLKQAHPDETHLVVSATSRDAVLRRIMDCFAPTKPNRLLLTHIDACDGQQIVASILKMTRLKASFYTDGVDLADTLKRPTAARLQVDTGERTSAGGQVTVFPGDKIRQPANTLIAKEAIASAQFLANKNSELFHQPTCRSVKRINAGNIVAFSDIEQAINEGFKPCRSCCHVGMIGKVGTGEPSYQRARAM
ncbi:MAG: Ada metal-binding domain-containing protein [Desulfosarcina sp.]|jgi:flagellar biosynthesis protein FlhF